MNVSENFDRLKGSLAGFVKTVMNRVDYLALYPGKVVLQNGDGTLQVQPDDARLPRAMDNLAIRYGLPGATVQVSGGTRVLVGFSNGRPDQPFAALWDPVGTVTQLNLTANAITINSGSKGVARNDDAIEADLTLVALQAFTFTAPSGGGPCVVAGSTQQLTGKITAGSSSVKCG